MAEVLDRCGIEVKRPPRGDWYGHRCPQCFHRKSPRAFTINPETGLWLCRAGCVGRDGQALGGDLLALIAACEGLELAGEDFRKVVAIAADIGGVEARATALSAAELRARAQARTEELAWREREQAERRRRHRAESIAKATAYWNALATRGAPGEEYLRERGLLDVVALGLVRFDRGDYDSIALALRTSDGQVANVIRRRLPAWAPTKDDRFRPLARLYALGTYVGALSEIEPGRDVVLVEGFADALTAALAWPRAIVLGARSATDLPTIAEHAAPRIARHGGRLMIAPHRDDAGFKAAEAAADHAHRAGLRLAANTLDIITHGASDLNQAWCAGWRPAHGSSS
ncbi:MAG TPA: toprim domain-containing protein [Kofleriaceae bacterium]